MSHMYDGMRVALIGQGLSENKYLSYSYIPVGGHKIQQVQDELKPPSRTTKYIRARKGVHVGFQKTDFRAP